HSYTGRVDRLIQRPVRTFLGYAAIAAVMVVLFVRLPGGFLPNEDQGFMFTQIRTAPGTPLEKTTALMHRVQRYYLQKEAANVEALFSVTGFSPSGGGQNIGQTFIQLKPWSERRGKENSAEAIANRATMAFQKYQEGLAFAFIPPAALELGDATGFSFVITDDNNLGHLKLSAARDKLLAAAMKDPRLAAVRLLGQRDVGQLQIDVDKARAGAYGLTQADINDTITTAWGGTYVNDFIDRGRVKRVYVQADAPYRSRPEDLSLLYVRGKSGAMTPLTEFASSHWKSGPALLERYNGASSFEIDGQAAPGYSSGTALKAMVELAKANLPPGVGHSWTNLSYEEAASAGQAPALYGLSVFIVFLCLAALYESWSIPFAVLLVVPLGAIGALLAATFTGLANDVFFQVGLITTVGVSTKNAILIVEFAAAEMRAGKPLVEAAITAARMRLRPILMTSLAFVFGVLPLAIATGAGSGGQNAIGRSVAGGMISATVLAIFFVPLFFVAVKKLFGQAGTETPAPKEV
ncbi:MAG: efflux transporter permease subunit, partial [Rhizorhabdus sp.]|nr:efflux transporter permease subunit [Rhizorhabdus sp.]